MAKTKTVSKSSKDVKKVDWALTLYMSFFFGCLGVDRFIMGKIGTGILKLVVCILLFPIGGVWWLIDLLLIMTSYSFKGVKWIYPKEKMLHLIVVSALLVLTVVVSIIFFSIVFIASFFGVLFESII